MCWPSECLAFEVEVSMAPRATSSRLLPSMQPCLWGGNFSSKTPSFLSPSVTTRGYRLLVSLQLPLPPAAEGAVLLLP